MRRAVLSAVMIFLASPAMASQCPSLWQQINDKMQGARLSDEDKAKLAEFRQQGETLHHAGKHEESEASLNQALALLNGAGAS